jgi:uncharacterized membrane protein HdeD (DUF308 family)
MTTNSTVDSNKSIGWSVGISVLLIFTGLVAIALPWAAGIAVTAFLGWVLVFSGVGHLLLAFHTRTFGGVLLEVLLGILYFVVGGYLLLFPVAGLATVTFALAMYLFVEGVLELILYFRIRPQFGRTWLLLNAIVTLILSILIWRTWPSNSEWVIGVLVGISMLFSGISRLMLSLAKREYLQRYGIAKSGPTLRTLGG